MVEEVGPRSTNSPWESLDLCCHHLHGLLRQLHAGLRGLVVTRSTRGPLPFQGIVMAHRITAAIESSRAPFQWFSRIPQQRSIGLSLPTWWQV
jgi:hypothetical protein